MSKLKIALIILFPLAFLLACGGIGGDGDSGLTLSDAEDNDVQCASGAVEIDVLYAPESELYLDGEVYDAINRFNQAYMDGRNPITGDPLADGEQPICVKGRPASSGQVAQGIINAIIAPNNSNVAKPTLFFALGEPLVGAGQFSNRPPSF